MKRRRAFSVLEMVWASGLVALLVGLTVVGAGKPPAATSASLADMLATELAAAKSMAASQKVPVAVRLHNPQNGLCSSLSIWRGDHQPRCVKNLNLDSELPRGRIFAGCWTAGATLDRPLEPGERAFSVSDWFAPQAVPRDPMLVFTPEGQVFSNDLPLIQGAYRWVACTGAEATSTRPTGTPALPAPPDYFALQKVQQPYTLSIQPKGQISLQPGLWGNDGSVALGKCGNDSQSGHFSIYPPGNSTPTVTAMALSPQAPADLPPGLSAQVSPEGHITFSVEAEDADGDALFCEFRSSGGGFTRQGPVKMSFDRAQKKWKARWVFRPQPGDAIHTRYDVECQVRDERGTPAVAAAGVRLTATFELVALDRFVYGRIPYEELYSMNADGSDRKVIPVMSAIGGGADFPNMSPDGTKILFTNQRTLDLWVVNIDGSGARRLTAGRGCYGARWSPDGSKIAAIAEFGGPAQLYLMPASGELDPPVGGSPLLPPQQLTSGIELPWGYPSFNADGTKIVMLGSPLGSPLIGLYLYDLTTRSGSFLTPPEARSGFQGYSNPSFCPDPANADLIAFDYGNGTDRHLEVINARTRVRTPIAAGGGRSYVSTAVWSPSGTRMAFLTDRICVGDFSLAGAAVNNERTLFDLPGTYDW